MSMGQEIPASIARNRWRTFQELVDYVVRAFIGIRAMAPKSRADASFA
jgi:hypothetical protein